MDTITAASASISHIDENDSVVKTWRLEGKKTYKIGRSQDNDISLDNTWVSRQHAMLQVEDNGSFLAIDLGSANGTFVNGTKIYSPTLLHSGDLVQIGTRTKLTFIQNYVVVQNVSFDDIDEETVAFMEKEYVTILICDIRSFTSLSEKIDAQRVSDILKSWSQNTNQIVRLYHGRVDKFIGDAVMAIWSGQASNRHNVHMALTCALKISEMTREMSEELGDLPWPLTIGAALNSGEVVVGNVGVDGSRDNTVIGDVVNVAFRLEEMTSKVQKDILVGEDAADFLDQKQEAYFFELYSDNVKGKEHPVQAYGCDFDQLKKYLNKV